MDKYYKILFICMSSYAKLTPLEQEIIEFLNTQEELTGIADFRGGFTDLTLAMGKKLSDVSNIRKAFLRLKSKNIVYRWNDEPVFYLLDNWLENLTGIHW